MKVFIAHSVRDRDLVTSIGTFLREDGHDVFVATEVPTGWNVLSEISAAIRSADVLVAVVTAGNPNVFYELGLAMGASVPTLITAPAGELLPADIASVPYVQLTGDILRDAKTIARRTNELRGVSPPTKPTKFKSAEAALQAATRDPAILESLSPIDFERLVKELFKERGYAVTPTRFTGELGVDFVIKSENESEYGEFVLVVVKKLNRQSRVSVETVRRLQFAVSVMDAPMGMLVATSGYTAAALALAAGTPILLRTLDDILAAKSKKELLESKPYDGSIISFI
jgi:HJR/Mrr/RecB family endonuclease